MYTWQDKYLFLKILISSDKMQWLSHMICDLSICQRICILCDLFSVAIVQCAQSNGKAIGHGSFFPRFVPICTKKNIYSSMWCSTYPDIHPRYPTRILNHCRNIDHGNNDKKNYNSRCPLDCSLSAKDLSLLQKSLRGSHAPVSIPRRHIIRRRLLLTR